MMNSQHIVVSCFLKKDEESTDEIGLIGIHRFYESGIVFKEYKDYFCISNGT